MTLCSKSHRNTSPLSNWTQDNNLNTHKNIRLKWLLLSSWQLQLQGKRQLQRWLSGSRKGWPAPSRRKGLVTWLLLSLAPLVGISAWSRWSDGWTRSHFPTLMITWLTIVWNVRHLYQGRAILMKGHLVATVISSGLMNGQITEEKGFNQVAVSDVKPPRHQKDTYWLQNLGAFGTRPKDQTKILASGCLSRCYIQ